MNQNSETPFKLYRIDPGAFVKPAFAICTAYRKSAAHVKSECFVLIQTSPTEGLAFGSEFSYTNNSDASCPIVLDETFAMDDALHQAETIYSIRSLELDPTLLEKRGWGSATFGEIPQHRLVGVWAHTPLSQALLNIADRTNCEALSNFINALRSLPTIKQTQLTL